MHIHVIGAVFVLCGLINTTAATAATCHDTYGDSLRNVSVEAIRYAERGQFFKSYCSSSGELKQSARGVDLTIPVKGVVVGFSGSTSDARQTAQEICSQHASQSQRDGSTYRESSTVVVDALELLNECVLLEQRGVRISHVFQAPRSAIINVDFDPTKSTVVIQGITYDATKGKCRSTLTSATGGAAVDLGRDLPETKANRSFSIICERTPMADASGNEVYPRLTVGIATNHGPYTAVFPPEGLAGPDLASTYEANLARLQASLASLRAENDSLMATIARVRDRADGLKRRIDRHRVRLFAVSTGDAAVRGFRHAGLAGNLSQYLKRLCGDDRVKRTRVEHHGGGSEGYSYYAVACVRL